MTKKDYENAAQIIRAEYAGVDAMPASVRRSLKNQREADVKLFCKFFANDNSRFDEARFRKACGADGAPSVLCDSKP